MKLSEVTMQEICKIDSTEILPTSPQTDFGAMRYRQVALDAFLRLEKLEAENAALKKRLELAETVCMALEPWEILRITGYKRGDESELLSQANIAMVDRLMQVWQKEKNEQQNNKELG